MCSLEYDRTIAVSREQRRQDFINTYAKEPSESELDIFIKYVGLVKEARR